jgi:hypothetical protein
MPEMHYLKKQTIEQHSVFFIDVHFAGSITGRTHACGI